MPDDDNDEAGPSPDEDREPVASYGDRDERFTLDADPAYVVQRLLTGKIE